jgi:hypothetical protein
MTKKIVFVKRAKIKNLIINVVKEDLVMKNIEIFDPAMCCSTGVCGPSIDPELLRVATVINSLKEKVLL